MAQIDIVTYGFAVVQIYVAFWIYFICCVVATTSVFRRVYYKFFLGYACLIPAYSKFMALFTK